MRICGTTIAKGVAVSADFGGVGFGQIRLRFIEFVEACLLFRALSVDRCVWWGLAVVPSTSRRSAQVSFLQSASATGSGITTHAALAQFEVVRLVRDLARKQNAPGLAQLASRMRLAFNSGAGGDVFAKVKGLIQERVAFARMASEMPIAAAKTKPKVALASTSWVLRRLPSGQTHLCFFGRAWFWNAAC